MGPPAATADRDDLRRLIEASLTGFDSGVDCAGTAGHDLASTTGAVGLEAEHLVVDVARDGTPRGRVGLAELTAVLNEHPDLTVEGPHGGTLAGWHDGRGGRLIPEPGAQLEYAGPPHGSARAALNASDRTLDDVVAHLTARGMALVSAGLDLWHPTGAVRQQLRLPRYEAMHAYFSRRTPHGHTMMTCSASLQINLDLGPTAACAAERWTVAMAVAPLATATFACSPVPGAVNGRALVWQGLDPTRTGIPQAFVAGAGAPADVLTEAALDADVLLFRSHDGAVPGEPGFTLRRWLRDGHDRHGAPTEADLAYHLSTLFPEVRARGFLEIRSVDALPRRWRAVPVALYCGLLYDARTRALVLRLLEPHRARLPELLRRAATVGTADPELCALSVEVWAAAAEGAARLGPNYLNPADVQRAQAFLDRFTLRGRSPADELRDRFADGPAAALDWAREPTGTLRIC